MIDIELSGDAMRWTPDMDIDGDNEGCGCGHTHDDTGCPTPGQPCGDYRCCIN